MIEKWDRRFIELAKEVSYWSKDPTQRVGAVLVSPDRRRIAIGYNGLPAGVADSPDRLEDRETRLSLTVHAEMNAILNCPERPAGWTLYCTKFPCTQCAAGVIQSGVARVMVPEWAQLSSWARNHIRAEALMMEAGVRVDMELAHEFFDDSHVDADCVHNQLDERGRCRWCGRDSHVPGRP